MESFASRSLLSLALPSFHRMLKRAHMDVKPHQLTGVHWLLQAERDHCWSGGLLADDMGLGKTIMLLGLTAEHKKSHTLIVVPLALLDQWREQVLRLTGKAPLVFHGPSSKRVTREQLDDAHIVITTYHGVGLQRRRRAKNDATADSPPAPTSGHRVVTDSNLSLLHTLSWDRVIYDEAHHLRNRYTARYIGAAHLRTECTWLVTGTPVQNRKTDLKSLADLVGVGRDTLVAERMLRRTKEEAHITLPSLVSSSNNVEWTSPEEKQFVEKVHSLYNGFHTKNTRASSSISFASTDTEEAGGPHTETPPPEKRGEHLVLLTRCRQSCVLPRLLAKSMRYSTHTDATEKERRNEEEFYSRAIEASSRLDNVVQHILYHDNPKDEPAGSMRRKIVFCNYRGEMDFLQQKLVQESCYRLRVNTIDGRTTTKARRDHMQNSDVLLLQIQTSCEGLNLQHFQDVYFVSPHWNPFVEKQAVARCHRIGQTREVRVFRFFLGTSPSGHTHVQATTRANRKGENSPKESPAPMLMDNYIMDAQDRKAQIAEDFGLGALSI